MNDKIKFATMGVIVTLLTIGVYWLFSDVIGIKAFIVAILYTPIIYIFRYYLSKYWVFTKS